MKNIIKKIPIPLSALMLALATTGNLVLSYGETYKNIFGFISASILLLLILKIIFDPTGIIESYKNPIIAGVAPTFFMGLMILSTYLKPYTYSFAFGVWILSLLLHCLLIIFFTMKFILNFNIKEVFPSHFVVYVGIVVGSITAPMYNLAYIGRLLFYFGFICYLCILPIVFYRIIFIKEIPESALPTFTIFAAPPSLCLAGYLSSFQEKSNVIICFLGILSFLTFISIILYLPKMLKIKFYPSYSSFTFPLVITAVAMKKVNTYLIKTNNPIYLLKYLIKFQEILAVSIVVYVLVRYFNYLFLEKSDSKIDKTKTYVP